MNRRTLLKCIEITKGLAPTNFNHKTFHTTFIFRKNKLQKIGINSSKTHPKNMHLDHRGRHDGVDIRQFVSMHSELSAVLKYGEEDCSDCVFVNVRIDRNGNPSMAKPCNGCQDLLRSVKFKRLYFTNDQGNFEQWTEK